VKIPFQPPAVTAQISTVASLGAATPVGKQLDAGTTRTATGIQVSISPEARKKAEEVKQRNADIDASNLPDGIKDSLKSIREIEHKIAEKLKELSDLANDKTLNPEQKDTRSKQLQLEVSALRSGLSSAVSELNKAMSAQGLSANDRDLAHKLLGKS
jgi:uncharacterized phage infection (PIP) family protein YhgE